jgi:tryptophan-rich sensory protein
VNFAGYFPWIAAAETAGILSAFFSREGMRIYRDTVEKPPLSPPAFLFPVVWSILYALMGIGAARVYKTGPGSAGNTALNVFVAQLVVNFFWSLIFFNAQAYGFALVWLLLLWVLIIAMILLFRKTDRVAAWLQIPYLLWVSFAAYLNYGVWQLNR